MLCNLDLFYSTIFNELLLFCLGIIEFSDKKNPKKWFYSSCSLAWDTGDIFEISWECGSWSIGISDFFIVSTLGLTDFFKLLFDFTDFSLYFLLLTDNTLSSTLPTFILLFIKLELMSWSFVDILHFDSAVLILKYAVKDNRSWSLHSLSIYEFVSDSLYYLLFI